MTRNFRMHFTMFVQLWEGATLSQINSLGSIQILVFGGELRPLCKVFVLSSKIVFKNKIDAVNTHVVETSLILVKLGRKIGLLPIQL